MYIADVRSGAIVVSGCLEQAAPDDWSLSPTRLQVLVAALGDPVQRGDGQVGDHIGNGSIHGEQNAGRIGL